MPLNPNASVGTNIKEFRTGKTFRHTEDKFGKEDADRQALAVALHTKDKADGGHHVDLTADKRKGMSQSEFAGPHKSFPVNDKEHARLAIGGATRAEHAGHISKSEEDHIKSEARSKLGEKDGDPPAQDHKAAVAKMHPEHVHHLVKAAHEGKFGPEAQKMAQSAMSAQPPQANGQAGPSTKPNYASMFSGNSDGDADDEQPGPASSIFAGSRGGR